MSQCRVGLISAILQLKNARCYKNPGHVSILIEQCKHAPSPSTKVTQRGCFVLFKDQS